MNSPLTIADTQKTLVNGEITSVELVDKYLEKINKNKDLNAFLTVSDEYAYQKAKWTNKILKDTKSKAIEDFPLLGVVMSLKDMYLTKGIRTTAASRVLEDYVPVYSASVVERLENAGAIIIGKTNCDAWAHGASGENSDFGPTLNPWNKEYVPGGSSSGSAVAVASDLSLVAMGTDTGGSIRQPASFCNVVGFKPTYGVVPRYGVVAMASSLDSMGHFTHTVEDSKKVFKVTAGVDNRDSTVKSKQPLENGHKRKIGIPKEYFGEGLDKEVEKKILEAIEVYKRLGYEIEEVSLPHTKYGISVYYIVMSAEVSSNLGRYDGIRYGYKREKFGAEAKRRIMLGTYTLSSGYYDAYYLKAMQVRSKIIEDFEKNFSNVDALLTPVSPTPAFKIGEKSDDPLKMYLSDVYSVNANLAGIPGLSIPAGFSSNHLPIGFQLLGPRFSENLLFKLGEEYQRETDYHLILPSLG